MSTESTNYSDPQFDMGRVEPLAIEPPADHEGEIWTEIHEDVQRVLESLDEPMRSMVPHLRVQSGSTHGRGFYLFTYRSYSRTDAADVDPVVVGITFTPAGDGQQVVVDADICDDSTGYCIETLAPRTVSATREQLLLAARELAQELSGGGQPIAEALHDLSRGS